MFSEDKLIDLSRDVKVAVCGMYRTGHHYICQIITKNIELNTRVNEKLSVTACFKKNYNKECIVTGFRNTIDIIDVENPNVRSIRELNNTFVKDKDVIILVVRDPFNNYASIKKHKDIVWNFETWRQTYHNMIDLYNANLVDLVIIYDKFISSEEYRKHILSKLSVRSTNYKKVTRVTRDGGGSSFNSYNESSINDLLNRHSILDDSEKMKIQNDEKIINFYKGITHENECIRLD